MLCYKGGTNGWIKGLFEVAAQSGGEEVFAQLYSCYAIQCLIYILSVIRESFILNLSKCVFVCRYVCEGGREKVSPPGERGGIMSLTLHCSFYVSGYPENMVYKTDIFDILLHIWVTNMKYTKPIFDKTPCNRCPSVLSIAIDTIIKCG